MAGDWIKIRADLADDPAVIGIASRVGLDEFAVVGRLQVLWSWANRQSRDGHACGVTVVWIDRKLQCDGFAQALCDVGWLMVTDIGVVFPKFDRHNGDNAKSRALSTQRKQRSRAVKPGPVQAFEATHLPQPSLPGVSLSSELSRQLRDRCETREEKRRDQENKNSGLSRTVGRADAGVCVGFDSFPPAVGDAMAFRARQVVDALAASGVTVLQGHPMLHSLIAAGVTVDEFRDAGSIAGKRGGKGFDYVVGIINRKRREAHATTLPQADTTMRDGMRWDDTRAGIEAMGQRLGVGAWDQAAAQVGRGPQWPHYLAKVRSAFDASQPEEAA